MLSFRRYHPAYCTSVVSSSLVARRKRLVDDVDVGDGDDDMAMEVQTINSIRHKILTPLQYSRFR